MQGQDMALVQEVPHETVEFICFLSELDIQVVGEDICNFVEAFQTAIIVYDGFCATEIGAESQGAHSVGILIYNRVLTLLLLYDLNFDAFGTFSPLRIRSAPTFFPSLGQPYFGPKRLCISPQELPDRSMADKMAIRERLFTVGFSFIGLVH